jgi:hypothetical protein
MGEERQIQLAEIAKRFAAEDPRCKTTLVQMYSCSYDVDRLKEQFFSLVPKTLELNREHPLSFVVGKFSKFEYWAGHEFQYVDISKKFVFFSKIDKLELPDTSVLLFVSPVVHDGNCESERQALAVIGIYKSLLVGLLGRGFLLDQIGSFTIDGVTGKISFRSRIWRVPQDVDCRAILDLGAYSELIGRTPLQIEPLRSQIALACQFFSSALEEHDEYKRFFDYWTSLEILADGKSQKIRSVLAKATIRRPNSSMNGLVSNNCPTCAIS